jgi:hypothetical protein
MIDVVVVVVVVVVVSSSSSYLVEVDTSLVWVAILVDIPSSSRRWVDNSDKVHVNKSSVVVMGEAEDEVKEAETYLLHSHEIVFLKVQFLFLSKTFQESLPYRKSCIPRNLYLI